MPSGFPNWREEEPIDPRLGPSLTPRVSLSLSFFSPRRERPRVEPSGFSRCKVWKEGASAESRASRALGSPKLSRVPRERKGTTRQPPKLILHHGPPPLCFCRSPYLRQLSFARSLPAECRGGALVSPPPLGRRRRSFS